MSSWMLLRFVTTEPHQELPGHILKMKQIGFDSNEGFKVQITGGRAAVNPEQWDEEE